MISKFHNKHKGETYTVDIKGYSLREITAEIENAYKEGYKMYYLSKGSKIIFIKYEKDDNEEIQRQT